MTTRPKTPSHATNLPEKELPAGSWLTPPWTLEERLQRIEALGQRVNGHVRFICQVGSLNGISGEAKEKAVTAFYDRMVAMESQLSCIQEDLRLG
jgi:hypothetical protein